MREVAENALLGRAPAAINVGIDLLADDLQYQGVPVQRVDWRPAHPAAVDALIELTPHGPAIARANDEAVARMEAARPVITHVGAAREVLPEMHDRTILHAGPPIAWADMSGPLRGAIIGAALYEGLAGDEEEAVRRAETGAFEFAPCHERGAAGPMAGVVSASMPMVVVEDATTGLRGCATFNEGLGRVLRYGAHDAAVLDRLRWMRDVLAPVFGAAIDRLPEPIDLRAMIAQALHMGDDGHNRNRAGTSLLLREIAPTLIELPSASADASAVARFVAGNDHFFLNLVMAAAKTIADAASGVPCSSIVVAMARNGTEFGVRLSGTGERWFTGPSGTVRGLYLPGFGPEDANRDIGDSTITETVGLGGFAMAAAPAIVLFVGGDPDEALSATRSMYDITWAESRTLQIPALGFRGAPFGIDCRLVVQTGIPPVVNTGIAHREPGIGQIGAGLVEPPMGAFAEAVRGLAQTLRKCPRP